MRKLGATWDRSPSGRPGELKRNRGRKVGSNPTYAQEQAGCRRWKGARLERDAALRTLVLDGLARGWSPEQIAGRLKQQKAATTISHESIYRFIYAQIRRTNDGAWRNYLPRAKYKRGSQRRHKRSSDALIKGRVSIALRPTAVDSRRTFGHWEADLMLFPTPAHAPPLPQKPKSPPTPGPPHP